MVYPNTRHSVGISFVERLAKRLDMNFVRDKNVMGMVASREGLVLVQPTTFMNLNGKTVLRAMRKYEVEAPDVTVVHDDVETALGKIAVRLGGGARGHNGIRSTMNCLGTDQFRRVRVGVGRPSDKTADLADFVLAKFSREEQKVLDQVAEKAIDDLLASLFPSGFEAKEQTLGG